MTFKITLATLAMLSACVLGQDDSVPQPPVEPASQVEGQVLPAALDLFAKHLEAIGGADAMRAHKNRVQRGSISGESSFALLTTWHAPQDKLRTRFEIPGKPAVDTVFNDGYGWKVIDAKPPELVRNEELRQLRDDAEFFADIEAEARYESLKTSRLIEKAETGIRAYEVLAQFPYGKVEMHLFDADSGLRIAKRTSTMTPAGQMPILIEYRDYRDVSGVKLSFELSITSNPDEENQQTSIVKFSEIKANVPSMPSWDMPGALAEQVRRLERAQGDSGG